MLFKDELDSDDDCIPDRVEGERSSKIFDLTSCASGIQRSPPDTDGDGILDSYEGTTDIDGNVSAAVKFA